MGSFNTLCSISGLPINGGDPVRLFFVTPETFSSKGELSEATSKWYPLTHPVQGVYDDYGTLEGYDEDSPEVQNLVAFLHKVVVPRTMGDNYAHDIAVHSDGHLAHYIQAAWEHRLRVVEEGHQSQVTLPGIINDVWDIVGADYIVRAETHGMVTVSARHDCNVHVKSVRKALKDKGYTVTIGPRKTSYGFWHPQLTVKSPDKAQVATPLYSGVPVRHAFILESVWQEMVTLTGKVLSFEKFKDMYHILQEEYKSKDENYIGQTIATDPLEQIQLYTRHGFKKHWYGHSEEVKDSWARNAFVVTIAEELYHGVLGRYNQFLASRSSEVLPSTVESSCIAYFMYKKLNRFYCPMQTAGQESTEWLHDMFLTGMLRVSNQRCAEACHMEDSNG